MLCRERGDRPGRQAQARDKRPHGGDELPIGRGRLRRGPGPRRDKHRAHGRAGRRSPGRRGAARGAHECRLGFGGAPAIGYGATLALGQLLSHPGRARIGSGASRISAPADARVLSADIPAGDVSLADTSYHQSAAVVQHIAFGLPAALVAALVAALGAAPLVAVTSLTAQPRVSERA